MRTVWQRSLLELIRRTSAELPRDVAAALARARRAEPPGSPARWALEVMLENARRARDRGAPLCQDTGAPLFECRVPAGFHAPPLAAAIRQAVRTATRRGWLRENTVDPLTDRLCPGNVAPGAPTIRWVTGRGAGIEIRLLLKGGGSENVSRQYSLPDADLNAGRDWDGVRRCALDAVWRTQGHGCAPGILGLAVGGDRAAGAECAKRQLFRSLADRAPHPRLARLERQLLREANRLGIGPMGLGDRTTLLGVKIGTLPRLPACYFVSVAYMCWACRRQGVALNPDGRIRRWLDGAGGGPP